MILHLHLLLPLLFQLLSSLGVLKFRKVPKTKLTERRENNNTQQNNATHLDSAFRLRRNLGIVSVGAAFGFSVQCLRKTTRKVSGKSR